MKKDATSGMIFLIIGFCAAILAIVVRINIQTADRYHRLDAERDFSAVQLRLETIEANQKLTMIRQRTSMAKLGIEDPTTRP